MSVSLKPDERIILPLDTDEATARQLVKSLAGKIGIFKVGYQLGYSMGWREACEMIAEAGGKIMLDVKLDDIPNTVVSAIRAINKNSPWAITLHTTAGFDAMHEAVKNKDDTLLLGVTVLTSINADQSTAIFGTTPDKKVLELAKLAARAGLDGLVCSPQELTTLKEDNQIKKLIKVIPGIRPKWAAANDQARIMTPGEAINAGADYLVIGRPITQPPAAVGSPIKATEMIADEIATALH